MPEIDKRFINMFDLLLCLTNAVDMVSPELSNHHQKVSYLSYKIAKQMHLLPEQTEDLALAGLLHDVGALSLDERLELLMSEPPSSQEHALRGSDLLCNFAPLKNAAEIIKYHHVSWNNGEGAVYEGNQVPLSSHILHLADRVSVLIDSSKAILCQVKNIQDIILSQKGISFPPETVDAFMEISINECIWLDIDNKSLLNYFPQVVQFSTVRLSIIEVVELARIFSFIIDSSNSFTAYHSAGVAVIAEKLAELAGFSKIECKMMLVAGYLHDLGKLAVNNEILEKPTALDSVELNEIRSHTFYTYRLLQSIKGFETITEWASFHHEKLNGTGYPFHLNRDSLSLGSRIMAVADIFTALTENRPYRQGLPDDQAISILQGKVTDGSICPYVVSILLNHFELLNNLRRQAQE